MYLKMIYCKYKNANMYDISLAMEKTKNILKYYLGSKRCSLEDTVLMCKTFNHLK